MNCQYAEYKFVYKETKTLQEYQVCHTWLLFGHYGCLNYSYFEIHLDLEISELVKQILKVALQLHETKKKEDKVLSGH